MSRASVACPRECRAYTHHPSPTRKPDKRRIDSVNKQLDKLLQLCQNPRLQLRNSPPYLIDILPDMSEKLKSITHAYQGSLDQLFENTHFSVFLSNLGARCKLTSKLFKEAKDLLYDEKSRYRRELTKHSLIFSHILKDLEALYVENKFSPTKFKITKKDAEEWWLKTFSDSAIVPWYTFRDALFLYFGVEDPNQMCQLQETIDLTCNDHVSIFEFDVFVRLFQPWNNVIETWKALTIRHAGYMAFMTYDEVKAVLKKFRGHPGPGSYVYRLSCTKLGQWAIGYITEDLRILQTIIQNKSLAQALIDGEGDGFYLYPNGTPSQSSILMPLVQNRFRTHVKVSQEEYDVYSRIGSTFELCKICTEGNKNVRLEPCNHLLCKDCLINCQNAGSGQTCPFCRMEIKSIEEVILDPFVTLPNSNHKYDGGKRPAHAMIEEEEEEKEEDKANPSKGLPCLEQDVATAPACRFPVSASVAISFDSSSSIERTSSEEEVSGTRACNAICPSVGQHAGESSSAENSGPITPFCREPDSFMQRTDVIDICSSPPLTPQMAEHLLDLCDGNAEIAARVWRHFVPRRSSCSDDSAL